MKVVIFCGGMGVRMGEATQRIPKPMITVGSQPILWHIMRWYASWGHNEFILCLGHRAEIVKEYFLAYNEALGNDFVLSRREVQLLGSDMDDWRITFLDTGIQASIGDRLMATRPHIGDDEVFLCTYGDGLTDAPLDQMIERLRRDGQGRDDDVRPPATQLSRRRRGRGRERALDRADGVCGRAHQRRVLRAPAGGSSTSFARARTSWTRRPASPGKAT